MPSYVAMERSLRGKLLARTRPLFGIVLAVAAAVSSGYAFSGRDLRVLLPLGFVAVLFLLALRYGIVVGVLGSVLSALIFAHMLFQPVGSWRIENQVARQNLAWMILGGVALSYLFAPSSSAPKDRQK